MGCVIFKLYYAYHWMEEWQLFNINGSESKEDMILTLLKFFGVDQISEMGGFDFISKSNLMFIKY